MLVRLNRRVYETMGLMNHPGLKSEEIFFD